jgi:Epoxide hydrolase N terminus
MSSAVETATEIRPFHVDVPDEALDDLRRRIAATQWPEQETDQSQGVPLATMQKLARYLGRALRRLGRAGTVLRRDPSGLQVTALIGKFGAARTDRARHSRPLLTLTKGARMPRERGSFEKAPDAFADAILEVGVAK